MLGRRGRRAAAELLLEAGSSDGASSRCQEEGARWAVVDLLQDGCDDGWSAGEKRVSGGSGRGRKGEAATAGERTHQAAAAASSGTATAGSLPASFWIPCVFP
jgi:hypothetical protein